jgi:NADH dehydrogenase
LKELRNADVRITVIDKRDYHTFQPLLYQVATDLLSPDEVGFPIRDLIHGHQNIVFHKAVVTSVDLSGKQVNIDGMAPVKFDYLVISLGAVVNFLHVEGAEQYAIPLYTMEDAIRLKERILKTFEALDKDPTPITDGALNFCVVGGGPTGVEVAGALVELLHCEIREDYPNLPIENAQVLLYEGSPGLLGTFNPKLQGYAREALEERGVKVQTGIHVRKISAGSIELTSGETIKTHTLIWAAGLKANPVVDSLGVELARGGRIPVGPDLQLKDHQGVFAIGDIALMTDGVTGKPLPGLGATALQAGHHTGKTIKRLVEGKQGEPFHYVDKGTMAQVGRGAAVIELPSGQTMTGSLAWVAWLGVHLALLSGKEEKIATFVDWGWSLLTKKRGKRIILNEEDLAAHTAASQSNAAPGQ